MFIRRRNAGCARADDSGWPSNSMSPSLGVQPDRQPSDGGFAAA